MKPSERAFRVRANMTTPIRRGAASAIQGKTCGSVSLGTSGRGNDLPG